MKNKYITTQPRVTVIGRSRRNSNISLGKMSELKAASRLFHNRRLA